MSQTAIVAKNDWGECLATGLMRLCRLSLRHEGALGIGRLVVSLFSDEQLFATSASYAVHDID